MDYESYWRMRSDTGVKPRFSIIGKWIEEGSNVLSIGCGDGNLEGFLIAAKNCRVTGMDISEEALSKAEKQGVRTYQCDLNKGLTVADAPYDHIICSEILEHIALPEQVLKTIVSERLFRKSLICTIPNIAHFRHRLRLLSGRFPIQYAFEPSEHLRFWSIPDFIEFAENQALELVEMASSNGFIDYYGASRKLPLYKWWPNLFGNQICFKLDHKRT